MLLHPGVNQNIKSGWRHLCSICGGIGQQKLLAEVVSARLNIFLQYYHYDTLSTLGQKLTISLQCLQLEIEAKPGGDFWSTRTARYAILVQIFLAELGLL